MKRGKEQPVSDGARASAVRQQWVGQQLPMNNMIAGPDAARVWVHMMEAEWTCVCVDSSSASALSVPDLSACLPPCASARLCDFVRPCLPGCVALLCFPPPRWCAQIRNAKSAEEQRVLRNKIRDRVHQLHNNGKKHPRHGTHA